ncbi:N-6 DNA methylase [Sediminibacillus dalangtanensis]|uniref:N-6 DNA methylase n=1 Tax=Sediminibacillus dalangtanensis TaxID=2729421 RepID=A0ABX7VVG2_9BACI|nr:N-6 DNA methylase [Sediminibacillus dalangtanensis]QTN00955.1 N-6 DNA methylase [Sediminibacillus dalangtanensis]
MNNHSQEITNHYYRQVNADARKKLGQYFTPSSISEVMKAWILGNPDCRQVVDPAVGLGELVTGLPEELAVTGYDIDQQVLTFAQQRLEADRANVRLVEQDFLKLDWEETYQGIICNPPYIRFKHYAEKQDYLQLFKEKLGIKLSGFTNIYALFLLKAIHQLARDGRAAFIIPSDFLNADYGAPIKQYLLQQQNLHAVAVTNFTENWFEQAATTSALFFFDNKRQSSTLEFIQLNNQEELAQLNEYINVFGRVAPIGRIYNYTDMDPHSKWRRYYQPSSEKNYPHVKPIAEFARVNRGIATGDNKFFCISETTRQEWRLDKDIFLPCLSKSNQVTGHFFFGDDYKSLVESGAPVLLLNIQESNPSSEQVRAYLAHGEDSGSNARYLTKRRRPWYKNETRLPPDIFISTFSRKKVKFIRNEAGVRSLTCFHGLYMLPEYREKLELLMAYFMTGISQEILEECQRQYGKGLKKLEPNDIKQAMAVDLDVITEAEAAAIKSIYHKIKRDQLHNPNRRAKKEIHELEEIFERILQKP